jgi:3-oxoacyl-[acyl-carrier-protein] synthase-3
MVATSDEWIRERTGIRERRIASTGEACSDLAVQAGRRALAAAGIAATDLDMILLATCTGDYPLPATASLVQHQLGATKAAACDLSAACCGFVYALSVADAYIRSGMRHVLVIGSEVMSAITDWSDRNTCVLFGDGAGAAVISVSDTESGILSTHLRSDGRLCELIAVPGGGSRTPPSDKVITERMQYIKMKGHETFKVAVRMLEEIARETLEANKLRVDEVDLYVPHQANVRILNAVMERLGMPAHKVMLNLDRYGNTSAASIPIALDEAVHAGRIQDGSLVMLGAFGAGLTWASAMIRW